MIINSLCNSCLQPYTIVVQPTDVHLMKMVADEKGHTAPCPRLCGGRINIIGDPIINEMASDRRLREPLTVSALELYQAIGGMGLPDEIPKDASVVKALLGQIAESADVEEVNGKIYLHELKLKDGITIHLTSGQRGALILKITKERAHGIPSGS